MNERSMNIGENFFHYREEAGLSQQQLAKELSISQPHLSKIENGQALPSVEALYGAAERFGVPMEQFFRPVEA